MQAVRVPAPPAKPTPAAPPKLVFSPCLSPAPVAAAKAPAQHLVKGRPARRPIEILSRHGARRRLQEDTMAAAATPALPAPSVDVPMASSYCQETAAGNNSPKSTGSNGSNSWADPAADDQEDLSDRLSTGPGSSGSKAKSGTTASSRSSETGVEEVKRLAKMRSLEVDPKRKAELSIQMQVVRKATLEQVHARNPLAKVQQTVAANVSLQSSSQSSTIRVPRSLSPGAPTIVQQPLTGSFAAQSMSGSSMEDVLEADEPPHKRCRCGCAEENADLRAQIMDFSLVREHAEQLMAQMMDQNGTIASLTERCKDQNGTIASLTERCKDVTMVRDSSIRAFGALEVERGALQAQVARLQAENTGLKAKNERLAAQADLTKHRMEMQIEQLTREKEAGSSSVAAPWFYHDVTSFFS